ncbi:hypothetical protein [Nakamurella lactea]|uniref:hypothetical protein n=1 Tax=Nakamurella lactea TaxID=459515 RepID=UPI0004054FED|nr:hypothetical protein [Nakamurella lactea]
MIGTSCDRRAGDELTGDELTGDELTGDELTGDELPGDELPGDEAIRATIEGAWPTERVGLALSEPQAEATRSTVAQAPAPRVVRQRADNEMCDIGFLLSGIPKVGVGAGC